MELSKNVTELESVKSKDDQFDSMEEVLGLLENAPINVLYAGTDNIIKYVNPSSLKTLKSLEEFLPIPVESIQGSSIDVFHKNPAHQQTLLKNPKNLPINSMISVGPETLDLLVSPIYDGAGNYQGAMVTWDIVTEKLAQEQTVARIQSMVENAPINLMMCDQEFNITYINPKSRETLRTLQQHLPVSVDNLVGTNIDVFHKNPEHQRRMLADDRNLPHRAKIKVGDQTLDLLVSGIYDKDRNYMGPMVTWEVVTDKLAMVDSLTSASSQLASASEELSATATQMSENAKGTSSQATSSSSAAEEVSRGVDVVSTNTEEMVSSIKEIAKSSSEAAQISKDALDQATSTNETIQKLGEASVEIGNVIKVISSIAQQTNLLALNATIEAARAGDAGKGFAVVANEVKELAKQTANATEDITQKIGNIQETSKDSVTAIGSISSIIENLNGIAMTIATAVEEQTATTNEVSRVVQEAKMGVENISHSIQEVAGQSQQSASGAEQTLGAAKDLSELAAQIQKLVDGIEV